MLSNWQNASIHQLFEAQVLRSPDAIAAVFQDVETRNQASVTYRELNCRANQLAHHLRGLGVGPDVLVGLCADRSLEMVVGLLGILKAGGAYVPLDPAYPPERLTFMLEDASASVLLTQAPILHSLPKTQAQVVLLDSDWQAIAQSSPENPVSNVTPDNLAYVIYTSGSTGRPKGVMVAHRGLLNLAIAQQELFNLPPSSRILQFASLSFDASIWEIVMALMVGASLVLAKRDTLLPGPALIELLRDSAITTATLPPSVLAVLPSEELPALQTIIVAGEACAPDLVARWAPGRRFFNAYGPTETTVCATVALCTHSDNKPAIGRPISNMQCLLLDEEMQPVPPGVPAQLYLSGVSLARGYLNRPETTALAFIPNPLSEVPGSRLYKTGDLARYLPDGNLEYLGRIDEQVKIRGFRIELSEIETLLWQHPDVREAVVVAREDTPGDKCLIAYIVSNFTADRTPFNSECLVEFDDNQTVTLQTENISMGGTCLIGVPDELHQDKRVRLRLSIPNSANDLWLCGRVAWRDEKRAGIEFELSPLEKTLLQESVESLIQTQDLLKILHRTTISNLRSFLKKHLPDYMVPTRFAILNAMPLTPNGKIDRRALPVPDRTERELQESFVAPRTPLEEAIAEIWAEVLGLESVGIRDNFLELGGHSLLATRILIRVRDLYQVELSIRSLFDGPTVAELAKNVETARSSKQSLQPPPIQPISEYQNLPLSFPEEQMWLLAQMEPGNPFFNERATLHIRRPINVASLERSINEITRRHAIWRTTFPMVNGKVVRAIHPTANFALSVVNLQNIPQCDREAEALRLAVEEARLPIDLSQGPLLRATLMQMDEADNRLFLTIHHIIFDGVSLDVFLRELVTLYEAFSSDLPSPLPELPIQYADFAVWQRQWLTEDVLEPQIAYWKQQLADLPTLHLPTDHPRPAVETFRGAQQCLTLNQSLTEELKALSRREGVTLFVTLAAAFNTLLYRYSGQDDIPMGITTSGRNRSETDGLIGCFLNPLVLRTNLSGNPSFRQLLVRVREATLGAHAHQDLPLQRLVEELRPVRDRAHSPLFNLAFVLEPKMPEVGEWSVSLLDVDNRTTKGDLYLELDDRPEGLIGRVEYSTDLYNSATIVRMIEHFQTLLEGIVANPGQKISELPILTATQRQQILDWTSTANDYPVDACIHQLFEAQVLRSPDSVAVVCEGEQLTYRELNNRANRLAHDLQAQGVGPDVLVGMCVDRSLEMVVGILGILKAGGAYVPLDPTYPKARLAFMLEDAQVSILLTQTQLIEFFPETKAQIVCLDADLSAIASQTLPNPEPSSTPDNLAYVIYTSGSTGKPKGVLINHSNVVRLFAATNSWFQFNERDVWTLFHSYAFDFSVWEIWGALLHGGRLVVVPYWVSRSPETFYELLLAERVTVLNQTPSAFRQIMQAEESAGTAKELSLRLVIFGGEALEIQSLKPWFERHGDSKPQLVNMYGITETTVHVTYRPLSMADLSSTASAIGVAIPDLQVYVLDRNLQPMPIGIPGELYVSGAGLARGYLNRLELNNERFIPNPFSEVPGSRMYKSGDRARYLANGDIEYLGRIDEQVKIRGYRIELGEIEAAIDEHPDVRSSAVVVREDEPGDKRLVAYIVSNHYPDRVPFKSECLVEFDGNCTMTLYTEDLSIRGVSLVGVPADCQIGQFVRVRLQLPGVGEERWLSGSVIWYREPQAGIQFSVAPEEQTLLMQSVDYLLETLGFLKILQRTVAGNLRNFLKPKIPHYMVPSSFVMLGALPLTPNGKVARQTLPAPGQARADSDAEFVPPRTPIQEVLAGIWAEVLGLERVGIQDNFFELGGHSLLATQMISRTRDAFGVELPMRRLFEATTIAEISEAIEKVKRSASKGTEPAIAPVSRETRRMKLKSIAK